GLYRRAWLGTALPDRIRPLPVGPDLVGRRKARAEGRGRTGAELAAPGKKLSRLRVRTGPRRDTAGGWSAALCRYGQGVPRQGRDGQEGHALHVRDRADRRAGGRRSLGQGGVAARRQEGRAPD